MTRGLSGMTGGLSGMTRGAVGNDRGLCRECLPSTFLIGGPVNRLMGYPMDFNSNLVCHRRSMVALRN